MSLVRSGHVHLNFNALRDYGKSGWGWPSTSTLYYTNYASWAYLFGFNNPDVSSSTGPGDRYIGLPVRCLVYWFTFAL